MEPADRVERLRNAMLAAGLTQAVLAEKVGISRQYLSRVLIGDRSGDRYWRDFARVLDVDVAWLTTGQGRPPAWTMAPEPAPVAIDTSPWASGGTAIRQVGVVTAGDGDISEYSDEVSDFPIPPNWKIVEVQGDSAYPVIYREQFAIIDTTRGGRPSEMTEEIHKDLHDNIVLVQVDAGAGKPHRALLKRYCWAPGARGDFMLASVDGGRSSPFIPPDDILVILPVVGVIYEDPRRPRKKRWHAKTVVVETP